MPPATGAPWNVAKALALFGLMTLVVAAAAPAAAKSFGPPAPFAFRDRLYDVAYVSDSVAVVVGYPGKVFRSEDAGKTWTLVPIDTTEPLFSVFFLNDRVGWIGGRKGLVFKTDDAGKTWAKQKADKEEHIFDLHFANDRVGLAVGNFGAVFRTTDGGATWTYQQLEAMSSGTIYRVHMFDENTAVMCGEYPTWEAQLDETVSADTLSSFFRTTDGGATWTRLPMPTTSHLFGMTFMSANDGYVSGSKGLLLQTADGGANWTTIPTNSEFHLLDVFAQPGGAVAAVGNAGLAVRAENGAASVVTTGEYFSIVANAFNAKGQGIAVGDHGLVMLSADGGKSWTRLANDTP
ncbi:MAG: hypothetical protein IT350_03725 [Deltaproteobacteria bacterium]|nr:hypothetical protein [Deltaproteobacteria bacterium]